MPFYEYQCDRCGHHHEAMQKMADPPLRRCPACGKSALRRLVSASAFRLKGGGWYETDFKRDSEGKRNLVAEDKSDKADKAEPAAADKTAAAATGDKPDKPSTEKGGTTEPAPGKAPAAATSNAAGSAGAKPPAKASPARRGRGARARGRSAARRSPRR